MKIKTVLLCLLGTILFLQVKGQVAALDHSVKAEMTLYPNPFKEGNQLSIKTEGFQSGNLLVVVYDTFGREMYSKVAVYENKGYYFTFDNENRIPPGVYLVIASSNDCIFRQRLIVQ